MQSDNKHFFDKFDELKNSTEQKLNAIKAMYEKLDSSLKQTEEKDSLVKNIDTIKNDIASFQKYLQEEVVSNFEKIITKLDNDYKTEIETLKTKLEKFKK
ncbi:hypothetical protein ACFX5K_03890 [Rickettsiales bacterium LUAb2]